MFQPKLVAVSNFISFANPKAPVYPRLALGKSWNEVHALSFIFIYFLNMNISDAFLYKSDFFRVQCLFKFKQASHKLNNSGIFTKFNHRTNHNYDIGLNKEIIL